MSEISTAELNEILRFATTGYQGMDDRQDALDDIADIIRASHPQPPSYDGNTVYITDAPIETAEEADCKFCLQGTYHPGNRKAHGLEFPAPAADETDTFKFGFTRIHGTPWNSSEFPPHLTAEALQKSKLTQENAAKAAAEMRFESEVASIPEFGQKRRFL